MATLFVDKVDPQSGTSLEIGSSGDTITVPTGATLTVPNGAMSGQNYPGFEAFLSADQSFTSNTDTKVQFDTEVIDTNNCYDNSVNYRFTPNVAGKYFVYVRIRGDCTGIDNVQRVITYLYKNGLQILSARDYTSIGTPSNSMSPVVTGIIDMNGSTDYLEGYINVLVTSGTPTAVGSASLRYTNFGAYRIGA